MIQVYSYFPIEKLQSFQDVNTEIEQSFLHNPFARILLYEDDNCVKGYLLYSIMYERMEVEQLYVHPNYRRRGIASALLDHLIKTAHQNQIQNISLEVRQSNNAAIALYQKFLFIQVGVRSHYYQGEDAILMVKNL